MQIGVAWRTLAGSLTRQSGEEVIQGVHTKGENAGNVCGCLRRKQL